MKLFEMEGFLRGKCLPGDKKVNETNAEYLVRKFSELEAQLHAAISNEREWETAMMQACGEDGPKSVAEKFAELKSQLHAVVAENAALKSGHLFFMYSDETGFEIHKTQDAALASAKDMIAVCREEAAQDGWPEDADTICWGLIMQKAIEMDFEKPSEQNGWIGWSEYKLTPDINTPATDAAIAELRAEGVEMLVARRIKAAEIARQFADIRAADSIESEAARAQMFANELRQSVQVKGVQS